MWVETENIYDLRRKLLDLPYCRDVKIPLKFRENILPYLQKPKIGFLRGAVEEYGDFEESDSLHVRVYDHYLKAHIDRRNPIYNPLAHLFKDASLQMGIFLTSVSVLFIVLLLRFSGFF
ncbi:hypothetical protein AKJ49_01005 [candidate division MSBL1 archaeon SCGC-AAA382A03]|uniref:Uncharacterized protein n=1 Tax=candidate division MSBL1 archaeon SCGC-AAA382A03 TaxID=1698278 RepID=A0A133VFY0_9EURY|nr:hypothetical protein AKJ49_01005 [candidate division MSBL1 archaeon SCGC-AAA382A03]